MLKSVEAKAWLRQDSFQLLLFYCYCIISLGIVPIICFYHPAYYASVRCVRCEPLGADYVIVTDAFGEDQVCRVEHLLIPTDTDDECHLLVIELNCVRYCACSATKLKFLQIKDVPVDFKRYLLSDHSTDEGEKILLTLYGTNTMAIPETSFFTICLRYMLSPFYLFQYFSATVWCFEQYWSYAIIILVITLLAVLVTARETFNNLENLRALAGVHTSVQLIARDEEGQEVVEVVNDMELIPGQRIVIAENMVLPCDLVLLSGRVVIDEAMLTGESVPVTKVPIDASQIANGIHVEDDDNLTAAIILNLETAQGGSGSGDKSPSAQDRASVLFLVGDIATHRPGSVLFGGTRVRAIYGNGRCEAVVYRTGFRSAKGRLIASLLRPKDDVIMFISDALWVLLVMVIVATVLYIISSALLMTLSNDTWGDVAFFYLDMLTCAVPSALVASLSIATTTSVNRLREKSIFVSDTSRVNHAGVISAVSFDKTGTLTDEQLSFVGILIPQAVVLDTDQTSSSSSLGFRELRNEEDWLPPAVAQLMATCHNLFVYELEGSNRTRHNGNNATGDPLEVELLRASGWRLGLAPDGSGHLVAWQPPPEGSAGTEEAAGTGSRSRRNESAILKHFEFTPDRLRAASIIHTVVATAADEQLAERYIYVVKGSPETILRLCSPLTVPTNTVEQLARLARVGLRVIALARRVLPDRPEVTSWSQERCEEEPLNFLGLVFLANKLKEDTVPTIAALHAAKMHVNMITGDHIFTAIHKAAESGILRHHRPQSAVNALDMTEEEEMAMQSIVYIIEYNEEKDEIILSDANNDQPLSISLPEALYTAARSYMLDMLPLRVESTVLNPLSLSLSGNSSDQSEGEPMLLTKIDPTRRTTSKMRQKVELAITGPALRAVKRQLPAAFVPLVRYTKVFARAKPADKKWIVETLIQAMEFEDLSNLFHLHDLHDSHNHAIVPLLSDSHQADKEEKEEEEKGYGWWGKEDREGREAVRAKVDVLFCGDGANDMIALRAATVGISLCDTETSVAAPITSKMATPFAVIEVLREGRSSLVTAYVLVTFNILYGGIQTIFVNSIYFFGYNGSSYMFLEQDLCFALLLGIAMTYTEPARDLSVIVPPRRFLVLYLIFRLAANFFIFALFQALGLVLLTQQSFYTYIEVDDPFQESYSYITSAGIELSLAQILIASVVSSLGPPYQQPWYENRLLVGVMAAQLAWLMVQTFAQDSWFLQQVLKIEPLPVDYGWKLVALMIANLATCLIITYLADYWFLESTNRRWFDIVKIEHLYRPREDVHNQDKKDGGKENKNKNKKKRIEDVL